MKYHQLDFSYNSRVIGRLLSAYPKDPVCQSVKYTELVLIKSSLKLILPLESVLYFQVPGNFVGKIHKDTNLDLPENSYKCALNLPLRQCEGILMKWHEPIPESIEDVFPGPSALNSTPQLDIGTDLDSISLNIPHAVAVDDWHSVVNTSNEAATFISVRFSKECTISDIMESLK